jgi:hypothetical protein
VIGKYNVVPPYKKIKQNKKSTKKAKFKLKAKPHPLG